MSPNISSAPLRYALHQSILSQRGGAVTPTTQSFSLHRKCILYGYASVNNRVTFVFNCWQVYTIHGSSWKFPLMFGPAGERGGEDQKVQGRADEQQSWVPPASCGQGCANKGTSEWAWGTGRWQYEPWANQFFVPWLSLSFGLWFYMIFVTLGSIVVWERAEKVPKLSPTTTYCINKLVFALSKADRATHKNTRRPL